jgi:hypothetical protein
MDNEINYLQEIQKHIFKLIKDDSDYGREHSETIYIDKGFEILCSMAEGWRPWMGKFIGRHANESRTNAIWKEIEPELATSITAKIKEVKAKRIKMEINAVTAKALTSCAMKDAGLEYQFIAQKYRAKIGVRVGTKSKLVFYISYKKLAESLPAVIESATLLKECFGKLGKNVTIGKTGDWESWE